MATNCWEAPTVMDGPPGVTAIESKVGGPTVRNVVPVTEPELAAIVVVPKAAPVASPLAEVPAIPGDDELHVAVAVRF